MDKTTENCYFIAFWMIYLQELCVSLKVVMYGLWDENLLEYDAIFSNILKITTQLN